MQFFAGRNFLASEERFSFTDKEEVEVVKRYVAEDYATVLAIRFMLGT